VATAQPANPNWVDYSVPFQIAHDNIAGVKLLKFPRRFQMQLKFREPPPAEIERELAAQNWIFREEEGVYTQQFGQMNESAAIIQARRFYGKLCAQLSPGRQISR
jgi:hypothetical protein